MVYQNLFWPKTPKSIRHNDRIRPSSYLYSTTDYLLDNS